MGGLSAHDIYTTFKAGSGLSVGDASQAAYQLQQQHDDLESRVRGLTQKMSGSWRGDAAAGAQAGAAPLARVLQQSQVELATANSAVSRYSAVFSGAQSSVVPVEKDAPKGNFLNDITPWHTDLDKKIDKYNADASTNTRIYDNYSKSSGELGNTMPASYASVNSASSNVGVVEPKQEESGSGGWGGAPGAHGGSGGRSSGGSAGWGGPVVHGVGGPTPGSGPGGPGGWQGPGGNPEGWTGGAFPGPPAATTSQGVGDIPGTGRPHESGWGSGRSVGGGTGSSGTEYGGGFVPGAGPGGGSGGSVGGSGRVGGGSARSGVGSGGTADRRLGAGGSVGVGDEPGGGRAVGGRAGAVGGRGAAGQPGMGMGGVGQGGRGEDDGEHHAASYLVDDRASEIVGDLPLTAPPVIGE